jgi:MFS family permease
MTDLSLKPGKNYGLKWIYTTIFANIAMAPLSTIVVLYILEFRGSVIDASYAITAGTLITIPASYIWGKISDIYQRKKAQIIVSYVGLSGPLIALFFINNVWEIILIYVLFNFFITANFPPLNLLVMETSSKEGWSRIFSKLQLAGGIGATIGYAFAFVVTDIIALKFLVLILFFISLISIITSFIYVPEHVKKVARTAIETDHSAFLSRLYANSILSIKTTYNNTIKIIKSFKFRNLMHGTLSKLYFAIFLFFVGAGLFNAVYPAGLKQHGLSESAIFMVIFAATMVQTIMFYYLGSGSRNIATSRNLNNALFLRTGAYIMMGIMFFLPRYLLFYSNMIFYSISSGIGFAIFYTVSSVYVFHAIGESGRGMALGIYNAIISIGYLIGALFSGYISYYIGFWFLFIIAGIIVFISYFFFQ